MPEEGDFAPRIFPLPHPQISVSAGGFLFKNAVQLAVNGASFLKPFFTDQKRVVCMGGAAGLLLADGFVLHHFRMFLSILNRSPQGGAVSRAA